METGQRHLSTLGLWQQAEYVPAERFRTVQWREAAVVLALTALLTGLAFWWLRRRTT